MRTIINIENDKLQKMALFCQLYKISRAELIRQCIDQFLSSHSLPKNEVFGMWKNKNIDALDYQRKLRSEWEDEGDI